MVKNRIKNAELRGKIMTDEEASTYIKEGMTIAVSGFTPSGYPKAVPLALSKRARESNEDLNLTLITGASTGDELDGEWSRNKIIERRMPYQTNNSCRKAINDGEIKYSDIHLGLMPQYINYNFVGNIDIGIIEATQITEEGYIIPSTAVGITPAVVEKADKLIIEINTSQPLELKGMHDIYTLENPPHRKPIPIVKPGDRIGTPYVPLDKDKVIGVVITDIKDNVRQLTPISENSEKMAQIFLDFLDYEVKKGRMPEQLLPFQSGVGSVANAVLAGFLNSKYDGFQFYTEVIQDSMLDLIDAGKTDIISGTALTPSPEGLEKFYRNIDKYYDKIVLRPQEISNNPEVVRRLGVIAMNTAIEVDIYGNVNSSNIRGSYMMNGIGGSGDFTKNAYISVFFTESIVKDGKISSIVPFASHVDHTEHDVNIIITEQGIADLRGLSPKERAMSIINNCAHPCYKDLLLDYFKEASKNPKHIPILLDEVFTCYKNFEQTGSMKKGC